MTDKRDSGPTTTSLAVLVHHDGKVTVSAPFANGAGGAIASLGPSASAAEIGRAVLSISAQVAAVDSDDAEFEALKAEGLAQDEAERKAAN